MKSRHLLEVIAYIDPGPTTKAHLDRVANSQRYIDLSSFKRVGNLCGWCNIGIVKKSNAKYCSSNCRESAQMYCYPQSPQTKAWIFINKQYCTCLKCGEIFEDDVDQIVNAKLEYNNENAERYGHIYGWKKDEPVEYWQVGKKIGSLFDADHIVALCNGGRGIGLENMQVICKTCHHKKTARDLKGF